MALLPDSPDAATKPKQVILTLDRLKHELRLPPDDTDQDSLLRGHIESACDRVSGIISGPVLDRTRKVRFPRYTRYGDLMLPDAVGKNPIRFLSRWVKSEGASAEYWTPSGNAALDPDDEISSGMRVDVDGDEVCIWPPSPSYEWPQRLTNTPIIFSLTVGVDMVEDPFADVIRQGVILVCQILYFGHVDPKYSRAVHSHLNAVKVRTVDAGWA